MRRSIDSELNLIDHPRLRFHRVNPDEVASTARTDLTESNMILQASGGNVISESDIGQAVDMARLIAKNHNTLHGYMDRLWKEVHKGGFIDEPKNLSANSDDIDRTKDGLTETNIRMPQGHRKWHTYHPDR